MPYNKGTGPPQIITPAGETITLAIPDSRLFMKQDSNPEHEPTTLRAGNRRISNNRRRATFEFGYRDLISSAGIEVVRSLVRVYEEHPTFTFVPRSGGTPDTYVCRFTSDMPFIVRGDGTFPVNITLEQVGEEVIGNVEAIILGVNDPSTNKEGSGIYTMSIDGDASTLERIHALPSGVWPTLITVINRTRDILYVRNDQLTVVYRIDMDAPSTAEVFDTFEAGSLSPMTMDFSHDEASQEVYIAYDGFFAGFGKVRVIGEDAVFKRQLTAGDHPDGVAYIPGSGLIGVAQNEFWHIETYNSLTGQSVSPVWRPNGFSPGQLVHNPTTGEFATRRPVGNGVALSVIPNAVNQFDTQNDIVLGGSDLLHLFTARIDGLIYAANDNGAFSSDVAAYRVDWDGSGFEPLITNEGIGIKSIGVYEPAGGVSAET